MFFFFGAARMAAQLALMALMALIKAVLRIIAYILKQILEEVLEEILGNEQLFDEIGLDSAWKRHNEWISEEAENMAAQGASEEEIIAWAEGAAQESVSAITKTWVSTGTACQRCMNMDGETVGIRDTFSHMEPMPPAHPNCNCRVTVSI